MKLHPAACLLAVIVAVLLIATACHRPVQLPEGVEPPPPGESPLVRVRLANAAGPLNVSAGSGVLLFSDFATGKRIGAIEPGVTWSVVLFGADGELRLATPEGRVSRVHDEGIRATPTGGGTVRFGGREYRGELVFFNSGDGGRVMAVNRLRLDDYLAPVVAAEIGNPGSVSFEAMKAQAVAARSYAMSLLARNRNFSYDLTADTGDQVYRGIDAETELSVRAVRETAGVCITHDGAVATAFYHSTCGGRTAEPWEVWGEQFGERNGWLESVDDGGYDRDSQWNEWSVRWSRQQLLMGLREHLPAVVGLSAEEVGEPTDIEVMRRGPSGRNVLIKVITDKRVLQVSGDNIRRALRKPDGSLLPSTMFELTAERGGAAGMTIVATGRGFGHGLGMCQSGAIARAAAGQDYREILEHYYPRAKVEKVY